MNLRTPRGEPRRASQRRAKLERHWQFGDHIRWRDYNGMFSRADPKSADHAFVMIADRSYRVLLAELW